jgi:hypothetical protein
LLQGTGFKTLFSFAAGFSGHFCRFSGLLIPVSGSKARLFTNFLRFSPLAFQFPATFIRSEMRTPEGV